jgi:hypothetical protein
MEYLPLNFSYVFTRGGDLIWMACWGNNLYRHNRKSREHLSAIVFLLTTFIFPEGNLFMVHNNTL